ncbi:MAG: family penicillin-binding protein [Candidatus Doudnabacteria bacterium]|nr:family penicillin-binding protein [Candidatus Doudnabacteria bacterium]
MKYNIKSKLKSTFKSKRFWTWIIRITAVGFALIAFLFIWYSKDLPDPNKLLARSIPQSTKIYSRDGQLLYEIHGEFKRTLIPFSEMNPNIRNATVAIEDKNFYNEGGIDFKGIARSIVADLTSGSKAQGASTITQQFVRNAVLTRDKTYARKIKEIILSLEINKRFSKDEILRLYLNEVPYGRNAYGIEAASQTYFNKHAKDLDLAESAYLAAIPQAPSFYNPTGPNRDSLDNRKNTVLDQMLAQGYINKDEHDKAKTEVVAFQKSQNSISAPHFVFYIQNYLTQKYGEKILEEGGLQVTTTLDSRLQGIAEQAVKDGAAKNSKSYNGHNAALVAIDPKTGQILAMVGSKDYFGTPEPAGCTPGLNCTFEPEVNVATSLRQAGSSMKPYVYATAFKPEFAQNPATLRLDVSTNFGTFGGKAYIPQNYGGKVFGPVSIRQALAGSLNIPAVKTLDLVGIDNAIQTMKDVGITNPNLTKDRCGLTLVLGGCEVTLLDHTAGYSTFATEGTQHQDTGILKIEDSSGKILEQYQDQSHEVIDPQSVYELISIMTDNASRQFTFGSSSQNLVLPDRTVAAKTGTTQNFHDGWTLGFTPSLAAGVWTGNNDGTLMKTDAIITAGPIWKSFMEQALKGTPAEEFAVPDGIQHVDVDALSGKLPGPYTQKTKNEIFASFSVPKDIDDTHVAVDVINTPSLQVDPNNPGGFLPPTIDPQAQTSRQVYTVLHSEKPSDPNWENPVIAWALEHGYSYPPTGSNPVTGGSIPGTGNTPAGSPPSVSIINPADGSEISSTPFTLQVNATPDQGNSIVRIDLLVDGTFVQSLVTAPYNFTIMNNPGKGDHTFAVHAVDDKGNTADTSIKLNFK